MGARMFDVIVKIIGVISIIVGALGLLFHGLGYLLEKIEKFRAGLIDDAKILARKELGKYISSQSYWLSESKDAQLILKTIGEEISNSFSGSFNISEVRDTWRSKIN